MKDPYADIIGMSYPFPTSRKRMSMTDRGAQFSPFAALTGYDAAIQETGRVTDSPMELDVDGRILLDEKLRTLFRIQEERPEISVTFFVPDDKKSGGAYVSITGNIKRIDPHKETMTMMNGAILSFEHICDIDADIFRERWMDPEEPGLEV